MFFSLVGNSLKSSLVAIVVVDHDALKTFAVAERINVIALYTVYYEFLYFLNLDFVSYISCVV